MREIKFRAWVKPKYTGGVSWMAVQGEPDLETLYSFMFHYAHEPNLMQYTGLKDKNGREIYEGDIVSDGSVNGEVVWSTTGVQWESEGKYYMSGWYWKAEIPGEFRTLWPLEGGEVIGNIYENPELKEANQ